MVDCFELLHLWSIFPNKYYFDTCVKQCPILVVIIDFVFICVQLALLLQGPLLNTVRRYKGVILSYKWKKDSQCNGQAKMDKRTNTDKESTTQKTKY